MYNFTLALMVMYTLGQMINIPILYSKFTPEPIIDLLLQEYNCTYVKSEQCKSDSNTSYFLYFINNLSDIDNLIFNNDLMIVFDTTFSLSLSEFLSSRASYYEFIQIVYGFSTSNSEHFVYYTEPSFALIRNAILSFVKDYGWKRIGVIKSSEYSSMDFSENSDNLEVMQFMVSDTLSYISLRNLIAKEIKSQGVRIIVIIANTNLSELIEKALIGADMNQEGQSFIFTHESAWSVSIEGGILIIQRDYLPRNLADYLNFLINLLGSFVTDLMASGPIQGSFSSINLDAKFYNYFIELNQEEFSIFNIQNGMPVKVGSIHSNSIEYSSQIYFPGKTLNPPSNSKIKISISGGAGAYNPDGYYSYENVYCHYGSILAINQINNDPQILSNFELTFTNISDCGSTIFDYNYAYNCFHKHLAELGEFHIPAHLTPMALGTVEVFQALNISIPIIGTQTSNIMSSLKYYPQYARDAFSNSYTGAAISMMFASFGIKKCSLLYSDNIWGNDFKSQFEIECKNLGIKILNVNRTIPIGFNGTDLGPLLEIISLKTRYVVIEVVDPDLFYIFEALYDLGLRNRDLYFAIGDSTVSVSDFNISQIGAISYMKRKEMLIDAITAGFLSFYGSFGEQVRESLLEQYGFINDYMCLFFDAVYLGARAIDSLINQGINLTSQAIQMQVRNVHFQGCAGSIQINVNGNDKLSTQLLISSIIEVNSTIKMLNHGIYDPSQVVIYQVLSPFNWSINGKFPADIIGSDWPCPFETSKTKNFILGYIICATVIVFPLILGLCGVYKYYHYVCTRCFPALDTVQEETIMDNILYIIMFLENLQYIAIGPDISEVFPQLSSLSKLTIIDLKYAVKNWNIWNQITFMAVISFIWFILLLQRIFKIGNNANIWLTYITHELGVYFLPIIGELLFLPLTYTLFTAFQCTKSIGDNITDSFHNKDCNTFCWNGSHMGYIILSSAAILCYLPASLCFRPLWWEENDDIVFHFREQPIHSVAKSFYQILLIFLNLVILPASEAAFTAFFIALLVVVEIWAIFKKPYNYYRASLWCSIFIICVLWTACSSWLRKIDIILARWLLLVGISGSIIFGIIYQWLRMPSLLESPKGRDIVKLFRFELSKMTTFEAGIDSSIKYHITSNKEN